MNNADKPAYPISKDVFLELIKKRDGMKDHIGLTKREKISAMAMQGLVTDDTLTPEEASEYAVKFADSLLKELEETQ